MPDYQAYLEHLRRSHPDRPIPTEREYYAEYLRQPLRRWPDPVLLVPTLCPAAPLPRCVAEPTHERLYLAQTDRIDTRQLPQDIQPAMS